MNNVSTPDAPVFALINDLRSQGITLLLDSDNIRVRGAKSTLSDELKGRIQHYKKELVGFLRAAASPGHSHAPIPKRAHDTAPELSFLQRNLWMIDQIEGGSLHYNMALALQVDGNLDVPVLRQAFATIVQRHESLRTVFAIVPDGTPRQVIRDAFEFAFPVEDLSSLSGPEQDAALER